MNTEWEKIFSNHIFDFKKINLEYIKNSPQPVSKINTIQKWTKDLKRHFGRTHTNG